MRVSLGGWVWSGGVVALGLAVLPGAALAAPAVKDVIATYANIAQAMYEDSLSEAKKLDAAIDALIATPSAATLAAARTAWKAARVPYMQTEVYRFGNEAVDEWEGKVNAWPLDEGLIDYTAGAYGTSSDENPLYVANVIANKKIKLGAKTLAATKITADTLEKLHEALDVEANVATGYHAIEFLLWGQDLNGTGPGAGNRPHTDYDTKACTGGNCDRRAAYLAAASDLLVKDLAEMAAAWGPKGKARTALVKKGDKGGLVTILTGIGSLSYGELAGERMKLGLILHDPEEEHDCFADNTHNSHYYDQAGMAAIWNAKYTRTDGTVVTGASIAQLVAAKDAGAAKAVEDKMAATTAAMQKLKDRADSGKEAYDQMIGDGNAEGNAIVQGAIDALVAQTRAVETVVAALGLKIKVEGSDSLDDPSKVGK